MSDEMCVPIYGCVPATDYYLVKSVYGKLQGFNIGDKSNAGVFISKRHLLFDIISDKAKGIEFLQELWWFTGKPAIEDFADDKREQLLEFISGYDDTLTVLDSFECDAKQVEIVE